MELGFETALFNWVNRVKKNINPDIYVSNNGPKYVRINVSGMANGNGYVYCFIEKSTGDVLKAATYYKPAKHARGNIYEIGNEGVEKYGAKYLK